MIGFTVYALYSAQGIVKDDLGWILAIGAYSLLLIMVAASWIVGVRMINKGRSEIPACEEFWIKTITLLSLLRSFWPAFFHRTTTPFRAPLIRRLRCKCVDPRSAARRSTCFCSLSNDARTVFAAVQGPG